MKLNTDGAASASNVNATSGGIFRDVNGTWLFCIVYGCRMALYAEMLAFNKATLVPCRLETYDLTV